MYNVNRILDANANRAREAMRVMEEAARFLLDDESLTQQIKTMRHDFAEAMRLLPGIELHRDTPGDVGTSLSTPAEYTRERVGDVVTAAGKRLSEALRAIEEYSKTLSAKQAGVAPKIEQLRYAGYEIERRLALAMAVGRAHMQWRVCVLLSESLCPGGDWQVVAERAIEGGADCLQLREKQVEAGELLNRAKWLVQTAQAKGVSVIVNDRPDIAMLARADGVHLGQGDLPCAEVRKLVGPQMLIGVSTSKLAEARQALRDGADYCGVGPMFPTTTKQKNIVAGPSYLKNFIEWGKLPHLAIGGISPDNIGELTAVGVQGVAVSSSVCRADDPAAMIETLISKMKI